MQQINPTKATCLAAIKIIRRHKIEAVFIVEKGDGRQMIVHPQFSNIIEDEPKCDAFTLQELEEIQNGEKILDETDTII